MPTRREVVAMAGGLFGLGKTVPPRPGASASASPGTVSVAPGNSAGIFRARLILVRGANGGIFIYNSSGTLLISIAGQAGTDPVDGTAYVQGIDLFGNAALLSLTTTDVSETSAGTLLAGSSGAGSIRQLITQLFSPSVNAEGTAVLQLTSASADGTVLPSATLGQPLYIAGTAAPAASGTAVGLYSTSEHLKYVDSSGATYDTGRVTGQAAGQTVNATAFTPLTGLTVALGVAKYRFRALIPLSAAAAAGQWQTQLLFSGTATVNYGFRWTSAAGLSALNAGQGSFGANLNGPNPSVAGAYWAEYEGQVTVTAAGSLSLSGATTVVADTWTVTTGSYIEAVPVV